MLFICFFISILCGLLWANMIITDFINIKLYPYAQNNEEDEKLQTKRAKIKIGLIIIIALTLAGTFTLR